MNGYLLDENLPAEALADLTLPVFHATDVGLRCSDDQLWEFAEARDLVIVTRTSTFPVECCAARHPRGWSTSAPEIFAGPT